MADTIFLDGVRPTSDPISVRLPDGSVCRSTHIGYLRLPGMGQAACQAHVMPGFTGSLLSIGQLCDSGFTALYTAADVIILDQTNSPVLRGLRSPATGLWSLDITSSIKASTAYPERNNTAAATTLLPKTVARLADFFFRALGAPSLSTILRAFKAGFLPLPGVTYSMLSSYVPNLPATSKGHMDRSRQGLHSTAAVTESPDDWEDAIPAYSVGSPINISYKVMSASEFGRTHGDLTGRFPITSRTGNAYMMVLLHEELNYIHVVPLKNRAKQENLRAFKEGLDYFRLRGIPVTAHRLDNECSGDLIAYCREPNVNITLEFVPPDCHRANRAERAIRTWKNHMLSNLCLLNPSFPLDVWDKLLPQMELTLNLMRRSGLNHRLSAWSYLHGAWNFVNTPIAPLGTKVVIFEDPKTRPSWATHGVDGWYVGPAFNHFHEFTVYVPSTNAIRTTNTLSWYPHDTFSIPATSVIDDIAILLDSLTSAVSSLSGDTSLPYTLAPALVSDAVRSLMTLRSLFHGQDVTSTAPQRVSTTTPVDPPAPVPAAPQRVSTT